jgi:hypothetical protein
MPGLLAELPGVAGLASTIVRMGSILRIRSTRFNIEKAGRLPVKIAERADPYAILQLKGTEPPNVRLADL